MRLTQAQLAVRARLAGVAGPLQLAELGCRCHLWSQEGTPVLISFLSNPSNPVIPSLLLQQVVGLPGRFGLSGDTRGFPGSSSRLAPVPKVSTASLGGHPGT